MRVVAGGHTGSLTGSRRVDLATAAGMLGISSDAVRKRAKRGTLAHETGPDGKLYVWVDAGRTGAEPGKDGPGADVVARDELVGALRDRVRSLEAQLDAERQAHAETRRIAAMLAQRPALEAPRDGHETPAAEPEGADPRRAAEGAREGSERRPGWWRRFFGFG